MKDPRAADLRAELIAARTEQILCRTRGDRDTAALLAAWIDVLLDEWNRRATEGPPDPAPDRAV